jgi:hypothetical protein
VDETTEGALSQDNPAELRSTPLLQAITLSVSGTNTSFVSVYSVPPL